MTSSTNDKSPEIKGTCAQDASDCANLDEKPGSLVDVGESYTAEEERAVLRKIDLTILPMMCVIFFLQYLDKQSLSYASVSFVHPTKKVSGLGTFSLTDLTDLRSYHGFKHDKPAVLLV